MLVARVVAAVGASDAVIAAAISADWLNSFPGLHDMRERRREVPAGEAIVGIFGWTSAGSAGFAVCRKKSSVLLLAVS
jgi:hypothetical protein